MSVRASRTPRRALLISAAAAVLVTGVVASAPADNLHNDVANSENSENNEARTGTAFPVRFWISETGGDVGDARGENCNPANGAPAKLTLEAPAGSGLTFSPAELTINACGNGAGDPEFIIEICPTKAGTFSRNAGTNIKAKVEDADGAGYNVLNADVELTVTGDDAADCDGATDPDEIENNAPVVATPAGDPEDDEGQTLTANGAFTDQDADDSMTLTATLADGSALPAGMTFTPDNAAGTWTWSYATRDNHSGTVKVIATDESGATAMDEFDYVSNNVAPDIQNAAVAGSSVCKPTVIFDIDDPGTADTWAHAVDFNGPSDVLATLAAPYTSEPSRSATRGSVYPSTGTKTISLGVEDDDAGGGSQDLTHTVPNTVTAARFGPPVQIDGNGKGLFKAGSTIPVKVRAAACAFETDGSYTPVSGANLKVRALEYLSADTTGVDVTASNVKANADGWMRQSDNQYIYNLATPRTAKGTYLLRVEGFEDRVSGVPTGFAVSKQIVIR